MENYSNDAREHVSPLSSISSAVRRSFTAAVFDILCSPHILPILVLLVIRLLRRFSAFWVVPISSISSAVRSSFTTAVFCFLGSLTQVSFVSSSGHSYQLQPLLPVVDV